MCWSVRTQSDGDVGDGCGRYSSIVNHAEGNVVDQRGMSGIHNNALFDISESAMASLFDTTIAGGAETIDEEYRQDVLHRAVVITEQLLIVLKTLKST